MQVKIAKIFLEVFGNKLVTENLAKQQGLERLPSPQQLQGKIILRGSVKRQKVSLSVVLVQLCILNTIHLLWIIISAFCFRFMNQRKKKA